MAKSSAWIDAADVVQADLITYNAAIAACANDSMWQGAYDLLRQLKHLPNVSADLISSLS